MGMQFYYATAIPSQPDPFRPPGNMEGIMSVQSRNHVQTSGNGAATMVFIHGFGCDLTMWRFLLAQTLR